MSSIACIGSIVRPSRQICSRASSSWRQSTRGYAAKASTDAPASASKDKKAAGRPSIIPAGTVMKGLSVLKDQPDPVAMPDDQYPAWVWTLGEEAGSKAEAKQGAEKPEGAFDFKAERKKLRASNRSEIKARNFLKTT